MVLYCPHCEEMCNFINLSNYVTTIDVPTEYNFMNCENCSEPTIFIREDVGDGFENDEYYCVYPSDDRHIGYYLPKIVRESYTDAIKCEKAKIWTPAAVMVGRALEGVCKDIEPTSKTIYDGLNKMKANGMISEEIFEWSNELRVIRNLGAHATNEGITSTDAKEAIDFLQAILEIIYHLRPKFEDMKNRRTK